MAPINHSTGGFLSGDQLLIFPSLVVPLGTKAWVPSIYSISHSPFLTWHLGTWISFLSKDPFPPGAAFGMEGGYLPAGSKNRGPEARPRGPEPHERVSGQVAFAPGPAPKAQPVGGSEPSGSRSLVAECF